MLFSSLCVGSSADLHGPTSGLLSSFGSRSAPGCRAESSGPETEPVVTAFVETASGGLMGLDHYAQLIQCNGNNILESSWQGFEELQGGRLSRKINPDWSGIGERSAFFVSSTDYSESL